MPTEKSLALVLRLVDFSETSRVVTLFTRDFGKVRALAKGARRQRSAFEAGLDLLTVCRIVFISRRSDSLDLLTEAQLVKGFRGRAGDLGALYAGYYVAELLSELTEDYDPHPDLFDEAVRTLDLLAGQASIPLVMLHFELVALAEVGYLPALEHCVGCQRVVEPVGTCYFSISAGGVLCPACRRGRSKVVKLSAAALRIVRLLAAPNSQAWQRLQVDSAALGDIRSLVSACVCHLLGRQPRMLPYLVNLAS